MHGDEAVTQRVSSYKRILDVLPRAVATPTLLEMIGEYGDACFKSGMQAERDIHPRSA